MPNVAKHLDFNHKTETLRSLRSLRVTQSNRTIVLIISQLYCGEGGKADKTSNNRFGQSGSLPKLHQ